MRFSRDKRGYEHTFVVHADRRRGKPRSRLLYWFRTPPGVRVGRAALDEDAIRLIEEHNPDLAFDWTRILKGEAPAQESRARPDMPERRSRPRQRPAPFTAPAAQPVPPPLIPDPQAVEPAPAPAEAPRIAPVPAFDEDGTPTDAMAEEQTTAEAGEKSAASAAMARLGAEGLLRLRARHAEVLARISEKVTDPVRRDELKLQAERLDPDTWVTDSEVTAGLEQYEGVFESLRSVVGRRRRRRRRRSSAPPRGGPAAGDTAADREENGGEDSPGEEV